MAAPQHESRVILHVDMDCFFVQCEQLRDPSLAGKAVAVQQHEDIISVSYEAKALGVRKHDLPEYVVERYGGAVTLVHVPHEPGTTKVSYKPYQEISDKVFAIMEKTAGLECIIEEASIDEAYIDASKLCQLSAGEAWATAAHLGERVRSAILDGTGLRSSCGIGTNKLLAKLASAMAKPDGQVVAADPNEFMKDIPVAKIPGLAKSLSSDELRVVKKVLGIKTAGLAVKYEHAALEEMLGASATTSLLQLCRGEDSSPVQRKPPPATCSVSMSLTPIRHTQALKVGRIIGFLAKDMKGRLQRQLQKYNRRPVWMRLRYRMTDAKEVALEKLDACLFMAKDDAVLLKEGLLVERLCQQFRAKAAGDWRLRWVCLTAHFSKASYSRLESSAGGPLDRFFSKTSAGKHASSRPPHAPA